MQGRRGTPGDTHSHSYWSPRRLDTVRRLLTHGRQLGHRGTPDRASRLSRHSPWFQLPAPPARQVALWSLGGIQRRRSGQQASGCGSFSITISTDGVPIGAAELTSAEGQNRCGPCVRCQGKNKSGHDRLARQSLRQHAPLPAPVRSAHSDEEAGALTGVACRRAPSPRATRRGVSGADEAITTSRARTHLPCRSFAALLRRP
jgi:hypothetical protein